VTNSEAISNASLPQQVLVTTFALFFVPMFMLGMVSPQVIRLSVPDVGHVGRVAGRIYAWSTAGAIAGTFATGYLLISAFGTYQTTLGVALVLTLTSLIVAPVWRNNVMLYVLSIVLGGITGGMILSIRPGHSEDMIATVETNYYTIKVTVDHAIADADGNPRGRKLTLDHLVHSSVDPDNPTYIYYEHEYIQLEFLRGVRARTAKPHVLVVGGGGYTFPRYAMEVMPEASMDVVEIDPGVTKVAREYLGLKDYPGLNITHMDGRQFVAERAAPQSYDLVIQDAVNDLSVPSHLMTKEYNDAVKAALNPRDGVYLLTIIDEIEHGKLWKAAMATLRQSFPHVTLLTSADLPDESPPANAGDEHLAIWKKDRENWERTRQVYVIYAADHPLDANRLRLRNAERFDFTPKAAVTGLAMASFSMPFFTHPVADRWLEPHLQREPGVVLTDQFAPVDNLMADVFRRRDQ
jgi:spermidine synthase